jgi:hypothetical protein
MRNKQKKIPLPNIISYEFNRTQIKTGNQKDTSEAYENPILIYNLWKKTESQQGYYFKSRLNFFLSQFYPVGVVSFVDEFRTRFSLFTTALKRN